MDWVAVAVGLLILLAIFQLFREWHDIDPSQRRGNVLLIVGLTIAVVAPGVVNMLGLDPRIGTWLRLVGFAFVLGAAYIIIG